MKYAPGDVVALRDVAHGAVNFAWPQRVLSDDERGLMLEQVPGAVGKVTRGYPGDLAELMRQLATQQPELEDLDWKHTRLLGLFRDAQWWSVRLMWHETTGEFLCYYVDFRRPIVRNGSRVDTCDLALDIVVGPTGKWIWKDKEQVPLLDELGWLRDDDDRERFADAQDDAVAAIEARAFPFDGALLDCMPTTAAPLLPVDWDAP